MKATSRRRVLISSVAMLLVAMLALGTATFAWFTTQSQANAAGIAATTTKSSELKLAKLDLVYNESITYGLNKALKPASSVDGKNWYMGVAAAKTAYGVNNAGFSKISTEAPQTNVCADAANVVYVYDEMLNIKNFGGSTCNGVTITVNATFTSQCGRIAIVPCATAQTTANTYSDITATNFKANIYGAAAGKNWNGVKGTGKTDTEAMTATKKAAGTSIPVGNINAGQTKSYRILVWFEGNDDKLFDTTTDSLKIGSISFTVKGTTV